MPNEHPGSSCADARAWFSAYRDRAVERDEARMSHMESCPGCAGYAEDLAALTRQVRLRAVDADDAVDVGELIAPAMAAFDAAPRRRRISAPRLVLGLAGVFGLAVAILGLLDVSGVYAATGFHLGWELYSFEAALSIGFLLAAWRPERHVSGLLPVTVGVAIMMLVPTFGAAGGSSDLLREVSHLPVWLGLFGLLLSLDLRKNRRTSTVGRPQVRPA
jgi:predicted anti-sigma-YlaC factor YlaD